MDATTREIKVVGLGKYKLVCVVDGERRTYDYATLRTDPTLADIREAMNKYKAR